MRLSTLFIFVWSGFAMVDQRITVPGEVAIKVGIGEVCLQWSRAEMGLLGLICQIEPMEMEKAYVVYGGLDIVPRVNMALNLARYNKLSPDLTKRIVEIRRKLQGGLSDRRNQVVHGAHRDIDGAETTLTMVRWKGDKRDKRLNASDISDLAAEIHDLGTEIFSIAKVILTRALVEHVKENLDDSIS